MLLTRGKLFFNFVVRNSLLGRAVRRVYIPDVVSVVDL